MPPGGDPTRGHSHRTIEEIYLVIEGEITVKLGDDVIALRPQLLREPAGQLALSQRDSLFRYREGDGRSQSRGCSFRLHSIVAARSCPLRQSVLGVPAGTLLREQAPAFTR